MEPQFNFQSKKTFRAIRDLNVLHQKTMWIKILNETLS